LNSIAEIKYVTSQNTCN